MKKIVWIVGLFLVLWIVFGNPVETIAGWFWPESAAPWENVHAFYYPDRNDLTSDERQLNIGSVEACRDWVDEQASKIGDKSMTRGDYECGVGCKLQSVDMYMCRLTVE
jgi:hypothetical protein